MADDQEEQKEMKKDVQKAREKLEEINEKATRETTDMLTNQVKQELLNEMKEVETKMGNLMTEMDSVKNKKEEEMESKIESEIKKIKESGDKIKEKADEIIQKPIKTAENKLKNVLDDKGLKDMRKQLTNITKETKKVEDERRMQEKLQAHIQAQIQPQIQLLQQELQHAQQVKENAEQIKSEADNLIKDVDKNEAGSDKKIIRKALKIKKDMLEIQQRAKKLQQTKNEWDEYYMKIACLAALRSKEPRTPVGACIVDKKKRKIVGIGYNSMPMDKDFTWKGADKETPRDEKVVTDPDFKYAYVVHAAVNAITNKTEESIEGCTLYTTLHPDEDCAHAIIAAGIKEVVYCKYMSSHKDTWDDKMKKADVLFKVKGIDTRKFLCDLSKDENKYVKELEHRIKTGEQETKRATEPATVISREKFFMRMAKLSQKRPGDFKGKAAGACIVSPNKQIKAIEYSGEPDGLREAFEKKAEELYPNQDLEVDKEFFTHAEYRAIVGRPSVEGYTLYVTSYPCNMCAKVIVQAGITKVVYYKDEGFKEDRYYSSRQLLTTCLGATNIRKYNGDSQDDSQDEHKGIIEGSGRTYIAKITTITDIQ